MKKMKKCGICGSCKIKHTVITETFEYNRKKLIIPEYPVFMCEKCGETFVDESSEIWIKPILSQFHKNNKYQGEIMSDELTLEEQAINYQTLRHIEAVRNVLNSMIKELMNRGELHDQSKMKNPELEYFVTHTHKLKGTTYNSPEYKEMLKEIKPALDHHYAQYRHHPEHFPHGIDDMNLVDVVEMFCDWKASSARHADGNILKSIEANRDRFAMSSQLVKIFENTAELFDNKG